MATVLQTIAQEGLETDVNEVIGAEFLSAVRDVQPRYEAMVRERLRRDRAAGQNLFETIRALQAAIVNYAGKVIGSIEHDDPATVETARLALLPISNHRDAVAAAQRAGKSASAAATPASGGRGDSRLNHALPAVRPCGTLWQSGICTQQPCRETRCHRHIA